MTIEQLRAEGWVVDVVEPKPEQRTNGRRRRALSEDNVRVTAKRGGVAVHGEAALLEHAVTRLLRQINALPQAA